jgi:hypothetical protein
MRTRHKIAVALILLVSVVAIWGQQPVAQGPQASNAAAWLVSVSTWASGTLGAMANYGTSPGAVLVPGVNAYVTNSPAVTGTVTANAGTGPFPVSGTPQSTSTYAPTVFDLAATAATQVKSSGGNVYGFMGFNPNVTTCYLQFYNSTSATLGTSPLHPFGVLAGASFIAQPGMMADFNLSTGISTGQTTTATGSTPCSSAMVVTIFYN